MLGAQLRSSLSTIRRGARPPNGAVPRPLFYSQDRRYPMTTRILVLEPNHGQRDTLRACLQKYRIGMAVLRDPS